MRRLSILLLCFPTLALGQTNVAQPNMAQLLSLNLSMVQVSVDHPSGATGTGSGVVIDAQHVATNCHVLANARGVSVAKYGAGHQPIALKADWKHDLCLLKFTSLPFPAVKMKDSATLAYEQDVFVISYPNDTNVPQPSYGNVKALYPLDDSVIIRSDAAFSLGSSGGALFDQDSNLIGITTFKSPGRNAYYYSLPVEWIKQLLASPDLVKLKSVEAPFWSLPETERPFFMRVVIPFQNEDWQSLYEIASAWLQQEPGSADARYYLALAESGLGKTADAIRDLEKAISQNPQLVDAYLSLAHILLATGDQSGASALRDRLVAIYPEHASKISLKIEANSSAD